MKTVHHEARRNGVFALRCQMMLKCTWHDANGLRIEPVAFYGFTEMLCTMSLWSIKGGNNIVHSDAEMLQWKDIFQATFAAKINTSLVI